MFLKVKKLWTLLKPKWRYMHSQRASLIISASALAFLGPAQSMWPLQREPARASEKGLAISPPPPTHRKTSPRLVSNLPAGGKKRALQRW